MNSQLNNNTIIPKLRFPEFNDSWEKKTLANVSSNISYGIGAAATKFDGENKYLRITDINDQSHNFEPSPLTSPSGEIDQRYYLKEGDIVFARTGASVGKTYLYNKDDGKLVYAGFLIKCSIKKNISPYFIFSSTLTDKYRNWVLVYSVRSGQPGINANEYKKFEMYLPVLEEQQKIASFLSSVDKWIENLEKQKASLEEYKKGMMQKIFSQEIRFKDEEGNVYPKWEEKKLGEVGKVISGLTYKPSDVVEKGLLVLRSSNIRTGKLSFKDNVYVNSDNISFNQVYENDILICVRNGSKRLIGKNALIDKETESSAFGAFMAVFRSEYNTYFYHLFNSDLYKRQVHRNLGATINSINGSDLKQFNFPFPCKQEQGKIALFLSSIDKLIDSKNKQITKTKEWKKGLLQQMFI